MTYYSTDASENSATTQVPPASVSLLPFPPPIKGVYYWDDRIPAEFKTRHDLLLDYRQPKAGAPVQALKRSIMEHKWRFGGSPEVVSPELIEHYRREARRGSLSDAEFRHLQVRGYAAESHLYDASDTVPLAVNETSGRSFLHHLSFDGSHPDQYINEANALRANRRTYKSRVSRPDILDHLRGFNVLGPVRDSNGYFRFISFDLDRHSYIDPERFAAYVESVYAFLLRHLADCAIVAQVNPKNGSTVFFCYLPTRRTYGQVEDLVNRLDARAKKEIPDYTTPEIYPVIGPGKVYLPFNPEKVTIGEAGLWKKTRTKKSKLCSPMAVYSLAEFPEYVRTARKADADAVRREILAACQRPIPSAKKKKKRKQTCGREKSPGPGVINTGPKFRGRFLRTTVDFFTGKFRPDDDTIGKYLTPWARAIAVVEDCHDADELRDKLLRCIDLIPDTSFSDRLSDDPGELERVMDCTIAAILKGNGYQARPDESTTILRNLKKSCDRIGFVPSDPDTWAVLDEQRPFVPGLRLVWTAELAAVVRELAPVLNCTMSEAKEFLKLAFSWIEARNETAYSKFATLMNQVGIKGHNDKVSAFLKIMKDRGYIEKVKNYGNFKDEDGRVRKHGNFYVNTAKIVFGEQIGGKAMDQPGTRTLYLLYLSFLSSDLCEYLLEYRRLMLEERFRRRIRGLYSHTWVVAGKRAA